MLEMYITHLIKSAEYFLIEGFPKIPLNQLPEYVEALIWQIAKIVEIYLSM